jgi:DNA-binding transcriptional LysR family regulator
MTADHIRIRDLEMIIALHETGNVTRAAERVGISEPAFSMQMRKIERRLQIKLFERAKGGMATTACGRSFVPHACDSVHAFRRALHDAHETKYGERHTLTVGCVRL